MKKLKNSKNWTGEMAQQGKVLAIEPGNLISTTRTHMMEGENYLISTWVPYYTSYSPD